QPLAAGVQRLQRPHLLRARHGPAHPRPPQPPLQHLTARLRRTTPHIPAALAVARVVRTMRVLLILVGATPPLLPPPPPRPPGPRQVLQAPQQRPAPLPPPQALGPLRPRRRCPTVPRVQQRRQLVQPLRLVPVVQHELQRARDVLPQHPLQAV